MIASGAGKAHVDFAGTCAESGLVSIPIYRAFVGEPVQRTGHSPRPIIWEIWMLELGFVKMHCIGQIVDDLGCIGAIQFEHLRRRRQASKRTGKCYPYGDYASSSVLTKVINTSKRDWLTKGC